MPGLEGTQFGPYHFKHLLGQGGMSEVYLAYDEEMEREVAIKVMGGQNADFLERFRREAEAIDKLQHEHILPAYDYEDNEPWHYLVMKYVPGGTLRDRLDSEEPLALDEAADLFEQIVSAVQFAHDQGVIHRDIKPSNILLDLDNHVYLADFGLAKLLEGSSELTRTGSLMGTPEYMAPDLADGPATASSDIYALGVVLYQMTTGQIPFDGDTPVAVYWKHLRDQPAPPSSANPGLSRAVDRVILRALAKDPQQRYQRADELSQAFRHALTVVEDEVLEAVSASASERVALIDGDPSVPDPAILEGALKAPVRTRRRYGLARARQFMTSAALGRMRLRRRPISGVSVPASLPPLPARSVKGSSSGSGIKRGVKRKRLPYARRNSRLANAIIVAGLLIFIGLPLSLALYFSSIQPKQTIIVQPLPTTTGKGEPGKSIYRDTLATNTNNLWAERSNACVFQANSYHVFAQQKGGNQPCVLVAPMVESAAIQVDVTLVSGSSAGLVLRLKGEQFYDFQINNVGQFFFRRHDASGGEGYVVLQAPTASSAIAPGAAKNTLLVIAQGSDFKLYINKVLVAEVRDVTYSSGQIALTTSTLSATTPAEGKFNNLQVSQIQQ